MAIESVYTDVGRVFTAEQLFPELTHLAVGDGTGPLDPALQRLRHEIARTRFVSRQFVLPDAAGPIAAGSERYAVSPVPTRFIFFRFRFEAEEAQGLWSELGLFGGGVTYLGAAQTLRDVGSQAGDDRANQAVLLGGLWRLTTSETLSLHVSTAGASGVAAITLVRGGADVLTATVTFGVPLSLSTETLDTGLTVTCTGGGDGVLTLGDQWAIDARADATTSDYAAGGVYEPTTNPLGQVGNPGVLLRYTAQSPAADKGPGIVDIATVVEVIHGAPA